MKQIKADWFELSSGRKVYANCERLSIRKDSDGEWSLAEGYDGGISLGDAELYAEDPALFEHERPWTAAERIELADFAIAQWMEFRENAKENGDRPSAKHSSESRP